MKNLITGLALVLASYSVQAEELSTQRFLSVLGKSKQVLQMQVDKQIEEEQYEAAAALYGQAMQMLEKQQKTQAHALLCAEKTVHYQPAAQECAFINLQKYISNGVANYSKQELSKTVRLVVENFRSDDTVSKVNLGLILSLKKNVDIKKVTSLIGVAGSEGQFTVEQLGFLKSALSDLRKRVHTQNEKDILDALITRIMPPFEINN